MCIVTGPRIDLSIVLIDRMKKLFYGGGNKGLVSFDTKETVIELNGVKIEAFPSHHLDAMRGLPNVSFILLDEADFFPSGQQQDARDVSERYIAKSNPYIVMVMMSANPYIVVTQWVDDHIEILYAEEYHRPDYNEMLSVVYGLISKYQIDKVYIDGANPSFIKSLKLQIG
jgi:hypothetical protein